MSFLNLLENESLAAWLANSAGQLIIISILGFIAVKLLSGESAPARSVTAAGALVSMLLVFILSVVFQASNIAWYKADVSRFTVQPPAPEKSLEKAPAIAKPAVAAATEQMAATENISMPALPPLPDINMESAFSAKPAPKTAVISPKPDKPFQLKIVHCINALGLLWLCGIIFMLLKLGYGLAFIRGFRFGLNRIIDARVDRLLKIAAETFNKQRLPELYTSPRVESPVTIGMANPIVIIPEKLFATLSENELKSILLHELAHIYHYDHIIGVFKRIIIAANWWNPLAYRVSAKHAVAREEVADNYVLRELNPKVYSECLTGLAEKICLISSYPAAAGMAGNYSSLQHRVKDIMSKKRKLTMTTGTTFKLSTAAVCLMLALAVAGCRCGKPDPEPLNADAIIAKMAETYAKCKTYQDSGVVKTVFIKAEGNRTDEKPFATAFVRPVQFCFEYKEKVDSFLKEKPCYIVWRKGDEVLTWFYGRQETVEKSKSLGMAIAGATGVSGGSAHTVPVLLLPEVGGRKLSDIKGATLLEDAIFDGSNCFRIQTKVTRSDDDGRTVSKPTVIWIDKNTFLVRRIDAQTDFIEAKFRTETTTTYYPSINSDIPGKALEFAPPYGNEKLKQVQSEKDVLPNTKDAKGNGTLNEKSVSRLASSGYDLSAKQAAEMEQKLLQNPDDMETILKLLGYWHMKYRTDDTIRTKREKYILWVIEHHPDSPILHQLYGMYGKLDTKSKEVSEIAKKLWIEQIGKNPDNLHVLWNAGYNLFDIDKPLSEQCLKKGQSLDTEDPKWSEQLGNLYFKSKQKEPEKAFYAYKNAYPKTTNKATVILRMTSSAFDSGKLQEAGECVIEMQRLAETIGNQNEEFPRLMFNGNLTLGRIALKQGKTDEAGKYLLEAGKTPVSLRDGNPDFTLVKDLLAAGKKDVVVQFFQSCSQYWDKAKCDEWIKQINEGKTPKFKDEPKTAPKTQPPTAAPAADSKVQAANDYQVSGTIPAGFEPRANAKGEILFFEPKNVVLVARMNVQADANGEFHISLPANSPKATALRAEIQFLSEAFAPLRANGKVSPGKPWNVDFAKPFKKQDAVHYTGVFLDDISNEPVPYVGVYADSSGKNVLARADEKGRFDFYVAPSWGGMTSFLPWVSSDQYAGHSYFFKHNAGESVELKLIMERGIRVRVHTEDEQGIALPGVYVRWMGGGGASGTTDEHGDAILSGMLSRVRPGELTEVRKTGYELAKNPGPLNAILFTDKPLRIVLRRIAAKPEATLSPAQKMEVTLAQTAAAEWLVLVDEGKYLESWTAAATSLKEKETADAWQQTLKTGRGSFGKALSRKFGGSSSAADQSQKLVCFNIQHETVFENKQVAVETIDITPDKDGQWRVSRYNIRKIEDKAPATKSVTAAVTEQAMKGWKLSDAEAAELEQKVSRNPEDMEALTMLLGYYYPKMKADKNIMQKREKYILWVIANHPDADVLGSSFGQIYSGDSYPEAKKLWMEQLEKHPDNARIAVNAARYFAMKDDELAIKYFEKAIKLDPKNSSMWHLQLGDIYNRIGMKSNEKSPEAAAAFEKALLAYENAYANATAKEKESSVVLRPMAAAARKAGNMEKTEKYNNMLVAAKIITTKEKAIIFAPRPEAAAAKETGKRARSDVKQRMENIVFPEVDFKDADIFTVIRYLLQNSRRYDPDFEGVAIVPAFTKKQADGVPKITIKRTNISLANLLDDICRDAGMKYRIEQGMVVLSVAVTSAVIPQKFEIQKWQQENDMTLSNLPEGKITRKLNSIIIPRIEFEDLSIPAAIKILREQSKKFDPEWEGVNIFLRLKEGEDNKAVVNLVLTNKKLSEVIYFFCRAAKLKFQVEKYAVVISNRDDSAAPNQDSTNDKPAFSETAILALKGGRLSDEEAAKLEKQVALNPEDLISLTELLGYYFLKSHTDETVKQKREKYILWLIKNHPDAEVLRIPYGQLDSVVDNYAEAKKLWLEQLEKHPDNLMIVGNFARSVVGEDIDLAIKYYKKAKSLDPKNSHTWDFWLGSTYDLKSMSPNRASAKQDPEAEKAAVSNSETAMGYYESAFAHSPEKERSNMLPYMAQSALKAGKLDKAGEYANKMLAAAKTETKNGKLVYYGNFILGMLAVKKGDIDAAGKYLLEAGKSTGSATLNSFGPDMSLARELLAKGKRDIVLEFLKECSKFWKSSNGICDQWIKEMENGGTPDFSNISKAKPESNEAAKPEAAFSMQDRAVKMAQTAAGEWLALVDGGKYPESWTAASTLFKGAVTADAWTQMLKSGQTPFGKMLSRKLKSAVYRTSLPGAPDGQYVVIQYDTTFENKKDAVETVTPMLDKDGQWRVSGYYIK